MGTTRQELHNDTPQRLFGSECEYTSPYSDLESELNQHQYIPAEDIVFRDGEYKLWLKNGACLYLDIIGPHVIIEYATPECSNPQRLAVHERAGEKRVADFVRSTGKDYDADWKTYKRTGYHDVFAPNGEKILDATSTGYHENYETYINFDNDAFAAVCLESYINTREVCFGAGIVGSDGFECHQKARAIALDPRKGNCTVHGNKMAFMHRDDSRLELRLGDGNMSRWATETRFGQTSFILRLIEHDEFPDNLIIDSNYGPRLRQTSRFPERELPVGTSLMTPAMHQKRLARACLDFATRHPNFNIPAFEIQAAEEVEKACDGIEEALLIPDNLYVISDRIDWAAKRAWIREHGITDDEMSTRNLGAVKLDLQWEEIGDRSASAKWYARTKNTLDQAAVARATYTAPTARAQRRVDFLNDFNGKATDVGWDHVEVLSDDDSATTYIPY